MKELTIIKIVGGICAILFPIIMVINNAVNWGNVYVIALYTVLYFVMVIPIPIKVSNNE